MKLHVFDSCPFCVRAKAFIGIKGIECEFVPMALGQLPESLEGKLERFTVPVLERQDSASGELLVMVESLDIIRTLDQMNDPMFDRYTLSEALESRLSQLKPISAQLLYPRLPKLGLPELSVASSLAAFVESRNKMLGQTIEQALEKTEQYIPLLNEQLTLLEKELDVEALLSGTRKLNIDDIAAFAELRNYTMIAELTFSENIASYVDKLSSLSKVQTYPPINK